jgi:hypothetical protein
VVGVQLTRGVNPKGMPNRLPAVRVQAVKNMLEQELHFEHPDIADVVGEDSRSSASRHLKCRTLKLLDIPIRSLLRMMLPEHRKDRITSS